MTHFLEGRARRTAFAPQGLLIVARDFSPWVGHLENDPSRRDGRKARTSDGVWSGSPHRNSVCAAGPVAVQGNIARPFPASQQDAFFL